MTTGIDFSGFLVFRKIGEIGKLQNLGYLIL